MEQQESPNFTANNHTDPEKKKNPETSYSPVVMVLQTCASPNNTTPLRCKDFYSSSNAACRICHEDDSPDLLIAPCNCMGSLGRMHRKCLEKWLSVSNTDRCEICKYRFHLVYRVRHLGQWLVSSGPLGPKGFLGDMICLLVLLPLSVMSVYLCAFGANSYMSKHKWQAIGLSSLCLFLLIAFVLWSGLTFRFHYMKFRDWQKSNLMVEVVVHPQRMHAPETSNSCIERRWFNPSEGLLSGHYTPIPEPRLSYIGDINVLPLGSNRLFIAETRL